MKKYLYNGKFYTASQVATAATNKGMAFDAYISKFGLQEQTDPEEVKKKETPSPESKTGSNTGSPSESQSSSTNPQPPFLSPNPTPEKSGNDLYDFMTKPAAYVAEKTVVAKTNNLQPVSETDIKDLKLNRPDIYQNIKQGVRDNTVTKDIYDDSDVASITQKINKNTEGVKNEVIAANFKEKTGLEYNALNIASITATQRRDLSIPPLPGDTDLLDKEFVIADIDKNFQQNTKDPFLDAAGVYGQQGKPITPLSPTLVDPTEQDLKQQIINDPDKRRKYSVRRMEEEQQKLTDAQNLIKKNQEDIGSIYLQTDNQAPVSENDNKKVAEIYKGISTKEKEAASFAQMIEQQKKIAENASDILEPARIAQQKNFDLKTVEGNTGLANYLATEEGRADIGFGKKVNSDPKFAATVETLLADKASESEGVGRDNIFSIVRNLINPNTTDIPTTQYDIFKSLSDSGNDKIQAKIRLEGHESAKNYAKLTSNENLLAHLKGQDDFVVQENGKALKDELWAKVSAQLFKDNGNETGVKQGNGLLALGADELKYLGRNLSETERKIYEKDLIPDELSRTITSNFQTSGFFQNFAESLGGMVTSVGNIGRNDQSRIKENFNSNTGRLEEVGQYSPFIQELEQLQSKQATQSLTPEEEKRIVTLEKNTNLLNGWQKLKAGSGNITGQVVGQALFANLLGGVGGVLAKGLLGMGEAAAIGAEGAVTLAKGEFLTAEAASVAMKSEAAAGRLTFATAESGLKAETAGARILARNAEGNPTKWSFNPDIAPVETLGGKAVNYAKENANLFISSYANAYDGYAKEALEVMPGAGNGIRRSLYAGMMATAEGLSEKIFDDRKVFTAFKTEISPAVRAISGELSNKTITQAGAIKKLQEILLGGNLKKFAKDFLKGSNEEGIEEVSTNLAQDLAKAMILGQNYDAAASIGDAIKTYYNMVVDGALVAGMAARGDVRSHSINTTTLYHVANNAQEYRNEVQRLKFEGEITEAQRVEKNIIINTAEAAYSNMNKDGIVSNNGKDDAKNATYLLHTVNQAILTEQAKNTSDDIRKSDLLKQADRSKNIREGIYTGKVNVDESLKPTTTDQKVASALDIDLVPATEIVTAAPVIKPDDLQLITELKPTPKIPSFEVTAMQANPLKALNEIADQAQGFNTADDGTRTPVTVGGPQEQQTRAKYGDAIVDKAIELFPAPANEVKVEPIVLTEDQKKTTFLALDIKEKVQFIAAKKAGTGDEFLLQTALSKGIVTQPTEVKRTEKTPAAGDKVMYQGQEHTVKSVYDTPTGTRSYSLVDADGNELLGANNKPKFVSATSISPINTTKNETANAQSNEAQNAQSNNAQNTENTQAGNNEENKVGNNSSSSKNSENDKNKKGKAETNGKQSNGQENGQENGQDGNGKNGQNKKEEVKKDTTVNSVVSFNPKETQFAALSRLTKGIDELPADQQKAEIEKRAAEHEASYREFTKGDNKISDENSKTQRVSEFASTTSRAMSKFLTPKGKEEFAANKGAFENGSRIDENGKAISENDFVTLKEKVKQLRKEGKLAEIKKINDGPSAYLKSSEATGSAGNTVGKNEQQQEGQNNTGGVSQGTPGTVSTGAEGATAVLENSFVQISKNEYSNGTETKYIVPTSNADLGTHIEVSKKVYELWKKEDDGEQVRRDNLNKQPKDRQQQSSLMGNAMAYAARKREILGTLTFKETQNKENENDKIQIGDTAEISGTFYKVVGMPFGNIKVETQRTTASGKFESTININRDSNIAKELLSQKNKVKVEPKGTVIQDLNEYIKNLKATNEKSNQSTDTKSVLGGVQENGNQAEGGKGSQQLREGQEEKLALNFIKEGDLPTIEVPAKNKGKVIGTKAIPNPALIAEQQAIKDKLETLKELVKCLSK